MPELLCEAVSFRAACDPIGYAESESYGLAAQTQIAEYNQAILINPKYADAYQNRGQLYQELGRIAQAEQDLEKAANLVQQNKSQERWNCFPLE